MVADEKVAISEEYATGVAKLVMGKKASRRASDRLIRMCMVASWAVLAGCWSKVRSKGSEWPLSFGS